MEDTDPNNYPVIFRAVKEMREYGFSDEKILDLLTTFQYPKEMVISALNGNETFNGQSSS